MDIQSIQYLTIMPFGKTSVIASGETTYGKTFEFPIVTADTINSILDRIESEQSETEKHLVQIQKELESQKATVGELVTKNQTLSDNLNMQSAKVGKLESDLNLSKEQIKESSAKVNKLESDLTLSKAQIKEKDEEFKNILDTLINKVNWNDLKFKSFTEACNRRILLHVGDYISYNNKNYIVKKEHTPDPKETPDKRSDLYFSINAKVKDEIIVLVQGQKYKKGTVGSFRGTVYRCEVDNNTAPIGTPGYWTNLGPVTNYNK